MRGSVVRGLGRVWAAAAASLLAVALVACGGLPTSGPVVAGGPISQEDAGSVPVFIPDRPTKDATPQQIVEGFIAAGSGPLNNWETAQLFLAPAFASEWNPRAGVTVYAPGERTLQQTSETSFSLTVTPVGSVDEAGQLTAGNGGAAALSYTLARQDDGQWRITQAPQGIVLDRNSFEQVFGGYALQFFDPTWTYLVPDQRWFPRLYAPTRIAEALVDGGPSDWLSGAVAPAFTDGARHAQVSVPVRSGVATVSLEDGARALDADALDRMQTQLTASLKQTSGIAEVDMQVDDQPLRAQVLSTRETRVDSRPLVRTSTAFGFAGSSIEQLPGLSDAIMLVPATDIEVDADRTAAAVRDGTGAVWRVTQEGVRARLDARAGLVAPSIDPSGYIWSVPQDAPGAVAAWAPDGTRVDVAAAWPGALRIASQRVSRDGTRIAAIIRDGDRSALWVASILRTRDGAPTSLGSVRLVAEFAAPASALTWVDSSTLALLTDVNGDPYVYTQDVGGFGSFVRAPAGITTIAGGTLSGGVRLRDEAGEVFTRSGANWQQLTTGADVLAIQQGTPR